MGNLNFTVNRCKGWEGELAEWKENCRKMVKRFKGISAMRGEGEGEGEGEGWCINAKILSENCWKMVGKLSENG